MKAIVVGTDGSETAALALNEACDLAKSTGAKLHIVSAYVPIGGARVASEGGESRMVGPDMQVDGVLDTAAGAVHARGVEAECHARKGDPADALLSVADEVGADVIVVGNRGMTGTKRFLLGSVPDKISHH